MTDLIRRIPWPNRDLPAQTRLATREWLVTNGLGGYASGTVSTLITRRYHGLLIAALPAPLGRMNMLSHLYERLGRPLDELAFFAPRPPIKPVPLSTIAEETA